MSEPRTFVVSHDGPTTGLSIEFLLHCKELYPRFFATEARRAVTFLTIEKPVCYCRGCSKHFSARGFKKLPLVGLQDFGANSGEPVLELRNCRCLSTLAAEVDSDKIPDTERP